MGTPRGGGGQCGWVLGPRDGQIIIIIIIIDNFSHLLLLFLVGVPKDGGRVRQLLEDVRPFEGLVHEGTDERKSDDDADGVAVDDLKPNFGRNTQG